MNVPWPSLARFVGMGLLCVVSCRANGNPPAAGRPPTGIPSPTVLAAVEACTAIAGVEPYSRLAVAAIACSEIKDCAVGCERELKAWGSHGQKPDDLARCAAFSKKARPSASLDERYVAASTWVRDTVLTFMRRMKPEVPDAGRARITFEIDCLLPQAEVVHSPNWHRPAEPQDTEPAQTESEVMGGLGLRGSGPHSADDWVPPLPTRHEAKRPSVEAGELAVAAGLDSEIVRRIVRRHLNELSYCYEERLARSQRRPGSITVEFVVGTTGEVTTPTVRDSSPNSPAVELCFRKMIERWIFPRPRGTKAVQLTYQFLLRPSQ
jgi:hypothetical protein